MQNNQITESYYKIGFRPKHNLGVVNPQERIGLNSLCSELKMSVQNPLKLYIRKLYIEYIIFDQFYVSYAPWR